MRSLIADFFESRVSSYQKANVSQSVTPPSWNDQEKEKEQNSRRAFRTDVDF